VRDFHREVASQLLEREILDLYRLDLNGRAVALLYCFAEKGRGYYYLGGFDPEYARYSVGTVLTAYAIQQSIARGHAVFDFLRGNEAYKYRWNVQEKRNYRVQWLRGGLASRALLGLSKATLAVEHRAKMLALRLEKSA
jgi:CelD/BcsL family acetyltransferase involved in cellulose biosynthesis